MQKTAVFVSAVRRVVSLSLVVDEDIMGSWERLQRNTGYRTGRPAIHGLSLGAGKKQNDNYYEGERSKVPVKARSRQ